MVEVNNMNARALSVPAVISAFTLLLGIAICLPGTALSQTAPRTATTTQPKLPAQLEWISLSKDREHFVRAGSDARFLAWGFNYDHDASGRLIEDYWDREWPTIVGDFKEMKDLGANLVRIHLQVAKFMKSPQEPQPNALAQLERLLRLSEQTGLYLDLTGLGCYHKQDVPQWYDSMSESERWNVQAAFWQAIAKVCAQSPAVFGYDLMNEPILPGANQKETNWLTGELDGMYFVQRLTLDLAGRTQEQVARKWVDQLVTAIRSQDQRHLITVGVIPWNLVFPGAKPLFYAPEVGRGLDFVSVHFYPQKGEVTKALTALAAFKLGKPLLVEETFPLACSVEELDAFIDGSRPMADGWLGFYWGKTIEEYSTANVDIAGAITRQWLEYFWKKSPVVLQPPKPAF
jgi:hypothetical protein